MRAITVLAAIMSAPTALGAFLTRSAEPSVCCTSVFKKIGRPRCIAAGRTQYTIDDAVCPPTRAHILDAKVTKACSSLEVFLSRKPIAKHTQQAFKALIEAIGEDRASSRPIVLDSGCGTGRSTKLLSQLYPDCLVVGVDRSFVRLTRNHRPNDPLELNVDEASSFFDDKVVDSSLDESKRPFCEKVSENCFLVRAELVDFWRCCELADWKIEHHYLLYPNPYPTHTRLTQRWYGHPSFPLLLQLGSKTITIRSNWEGYLNEFARSVEIANEYYTHQNSQNNFASCYLASARKGPTRRTNTTVAWTNFEKKYDSVGEPTYELKLELEM